MTPTAPITITPQRLPAIRELLDELGIWPDCPDLMQRIEFALGLLGRTADNSANASIALEDIWQYVQKHALPDTYIIHCIEYGLGQATRPDPPTGDHAQ